MFKVTIKMLTYFRLKNQVKKFTDVNRKITKNNKIENIYKKSKKGSNKTHTQIIK
jgi:hypothetical protein